MLLLFPMALTLVGLIFLKYYVKLRVKLGFWESNR